MTNKKGKEKLKNLEAYVQSSTCINNLMYKLQKINLVSGTERIKIQRKIGDLHVL